MDPISLAIVTALAAGVAAGGSKVAEQAIVDGYNALKLLIRSKFGGGSELRNPLITWSRNPTQMGAKPCWKKKWRLRMLTGC